MQVLKALKFFWVALVSNDTEKVRQAEIEAFGGGMQKPKEKK
jgi:hypothetical protein